MQNKLRAQQKSSIVFTGRTSPRSDICSPPERLQNLGRLLIPMIKPTLKESSCPKGETEPTTTTSSGTLERGACVNSLAIPQSALIYYSCELSS